LIFDTFIRRNTFIKRNDYLLKMNEIIWNWN